MRGVDAIYHIGMGKCFDSSNTVDKPFRLSNRIIIRSGARFTVNGDVAFPIGIQRKTRYRTFAMGFAHNGQTHLINGVGVTQAVRRLTCAREPQWIGYDESLSSNQKQIRQILGPLLTSFIEFYRAEVRKRLAIMGPPSEERLKWASATHPKKEERMRCWAELDDARVTGAYISRVKYKAKPDETLRMDKYLRGVGDLSVRGAIQAGYLMDAVKGAFTEVFEYGGFKIQFVKCPQYAEMVRVFGDLVNPGGANFFYFSDDGSFGCQCSDGVLMLNTDISACDGSIGPAVFSVLHEIMSVDARYQEDIDEVFAQCKLPFTVSDPNEPTNRVVFQPLEALLFSGSCLTTAVDGVGNTLTILRLAQVTGGSTRNFTRQQIAALIPVCAFEVGFIVKAEVCPTYHHLQFLKHSPAYSVNGSIEPLLNIGVFIRSFGRRDGEFPALKRANPEERARQYISGVVRGLVHAGQHDVLDLFRDRFIVAGNTAVETKHDLGDHGSRVDVGEVLERYGITEAEWYSFKLLVEQMRPGDLIQSAFSDKALSKDYGLGSY